MLHFELAWRQQRGGAALDGDGVEMRPAIALPGKDEAVGAGPDQLILGDHGAKHAARTGVRLPDLPAGAIGDAGEADAPRISRAPSAASSARATVRHAGEGDLFAVGRPGRVGIAIDAGVEIAQRLARRNRRPQ